MSRLRAPGAVPRNIRPTSGLIRPPLAPAASQAPRSSPQNRPPPLDIAEQSAGAPFRVGDMVLVGGVKPGKIAFIGPTQFAQGVWAGVVLDTPDGKNDGSVKGVSYFQCPPNHGLFAKLDKLTLLPRQQQSHPPPADEAAVNFQLGDKVIAEGGKRGTVSFVGATQFAKGLWIGVSLDTPEGKNNGVVNGIQYFTCPPNHGLFTRPAKLNLAPPTNPPSSGDKASLDPSELKRKAESLRVGDRVLVNKSKEGILKFIGPTHFAKGIWVGVELDDAHGKNDGAVSGKRYFQCEAMHGLFAPLPKVEQLVPYFAASEPSITSPPVRRISGARGLSGSPVSSVSSLSSMGRVRQLQQAEPEPLSPARSDVSGGNDGFSHIMFEKDHQIATLRSSLEQAQSEKVKLSEEITELRRKVDDLQFLLDEQDVVSGDKLEEVSFREQTEIKQLKEQLTEERNSHQSKVAELTARLANVEKERQQLGTATNDDAVLEEKTKAVQRLEREKEQLLVDFNKAQSALAAAEADFKSTEQAAKELQSELEISKQQLQETLDVCAQQETLLEEKVADMDQMSEEKRQVERDLERVTTEKESLLSSTEQLIGERDNALTKCNRLMAESSSVNNEQNTLAQQCQELLQERDQLKQELRETKSFLEKVSEERDDALYSLSDLKTRGQEVQGKSQEITLRYESVQKELSDTSGELERTKRESLILSEEIEQLKLTNQQKVQLAEATSSELKQRLSKANREKDTALQEAQDASDKLEEMTLNRNQLIEASYEYQKTINELQEQLEEMALQYNTLATEQQSQSGDIQAQLEDTEERLEQKMRELEEAKERVTSLEEELIIQSSNSSDSQRVLALEEEKIRLEEMVNHLSMQNTQTTATGEDSQVILELKEDNRTLEAAVLDKDQEINFLNSVIAELQAKVDSLESLNGLGDQAGMLGYTSEDDLLNSQLPPPRTFCDICDEFDLHDTADCPLQAAESDSPPPSMHHGIRANERPYCENCEVFGHWTDECQYEETY